MTRYFSFHYCIAFSYSLKNQPAPHPPLTHTHTTHMRACTHTHTPYTHTTYTHRHTTHTPHTHTHHTHTHTTHTPHTQPSHHLSVATCNAVNLYLHSYRKVGGKRGAYSPPLFDRRQGPPILDTFRQLASCYFHCVLAAPVVTPFIKVLSGSGHSYLQC